MGSNSDHSSLNFVIVGAPTISPSSIYVVLKLSRIMAINRFKKMKDTTIMKLMKNTYAGSSEPHS